ncbi:MAG: ABC transporter ATP-binding protein [Candidatus Sumerlaeia bacterium]
MTDVKIQFDHVGKVFDNDFRAVDDFCLDVEEGETVVLLGRSGCGKTTTLKMVNRLFEITEGEIRIDDKSIMDQDVIELRRNIGYAIQHIGLFPHMTVGENISVVPRLLKWDRERIKERVDHLLEMVGLDPEETRDRFPNQLSGGQKQRIGVARALAADPPVILMDEPFGALDPITREGIQQEFLDLESEIQKTILFVTHDLFEAVRMGDRIALMDEGHIQQLATPAELVDNPANEFVDQFLGQHRFQLSLLTRPIRSVVDEEGQESAPDEKPEDILYMSDSLVEALDLLKRSGKDELPVYRAKEFKGRLKKEKLVRAVSEVLGGLESA